MQVAPIESKLDGALQWAVKERPSEKREARRNSCKGEAATLLCPDDLEKVIALIWYANADKGALRSDAMGFVFSFITAVGMATLNASFVIYTLTSLDCKEETWFCLMQNYFAWIEMFAVVLSCCRLLADIFILSGHSLLARRGVQAITLVHNLEIASSFSLLAFLPLPTKLAYWWQHKDYFISILLTNPPLMNGESMFRRRTWSKIMAKSSMWKLPGILLFYFIAYSIVQIFVPLVCVVFPIIAPFAFLIKMASLPPVKKFESWASSQWLNFLGIVNQTSKVWNVNYVEQRAVLRLARVNIEEEQNREAQYGKLLGEIGSAAVCRLGWPRAVMLLASLNSRILDAILSEFVTISYLHDTAEKCHRFSHIKDDEWRIDHGYEIEHGHDDEDDSSVVAYSSAPSLRDSANRSVGHSLIEPPTVSKRQEDSTVVEEMPKPFTTVVEEIA